VIPEKSKECTYITISGKVIKNITGKMYFINRVIVSGKYKSY